MNPIDPNVERLEANRMDGFATTNASPEGIQPA